MKISIVIPTYNEAHMIEKCLTSLTEQSIKDFEVIVVDDGSTDRTIQLMEKIKDEVNFNLKILKQEHQGAGIARNLGVKSAKGEILVFVDADMTFEKYFLEKLVDPILRKKTIGTFSKQEYVSNWDNIWSRCWNWNLGLTDLLRIPKSYPETQKVFRAILKKEFVKVGGFTRGGYTDDWSLSDKLKVMAIAAPGAKYYHNNPDTLLEVFNQSKWSAKRKYKLGYLGAIVALIRVSFPVSLFLGILGCVKHKELSFLIFKIIYDFGATVGIISYTLFNNGKK